MSERRILYLQYTNPAAYPPLQHSSRILADAGWDVHFLGTGAHGADEFRLEPHPRIQEDRLRYFAPGAFQKLQYFHFAARAAIELRWKPQWCYASDLWSCPVALSAQRRGCGVIYHEHDEPPRSSSSRYVRACLNARAKLASRAELCVLPSEGRRARFQAEHPQARTTTVWNCPGLREVPAPRTEPGRDFVIYYHGSIVPQRLPLSMVDALQLLPDDAQLRIVGYETIGSQGYVNALLDHARQIGVEKRVSHQSVPERAQLWQLMRDATVGVSLVPLDSSEPNLATMAGASNKPFEYLAAGLALLFSDRSDWTAKFVNYGVACVPDSVESITHALRSLYEDRAGAHARGVAGRARVLAEWNYERQFQPVLRVLNG